MLIIAYLPRTNIGLVLEGSHAGIGWSMENNNLNSMQVRPMLHSKNVLIRITVLRHFHRCTPLFCASANQTCDQTTNSLASR